MKISEIKFNNFQIVRWIIGFFNSDLLWVIFNAYYNGMKCLLIELMSMMMMEKVFSVFS